MHVLEVMPEGKISFYITEHDIPNATKNYIRYRKK